LLKNRGLVKTIKFRESTYIGDPINTVKIFNEKEVDELIFLDIEATRLKKDPPYDLIKNLSGECFMPFAYGGGINSIQQIEKIIYSGAEKVIINSSAYLNKDFLREAIIHFGSSTIVVSVDVKKDFLGKDTVYIKGGTQSTGKDPVEYCKEIEKNGAGEILINSIDRDGLMKGYDIELIKRVSGSLKIPLIACGGAGNLEDFRLAVKEGGASAVAAGSFFVYHGKRKAVLITYPSQDEISNIFT
jgi:cyclase